MPGSRKGHAMVLVSLRRPDERDLAAAAKLLGLTKAEGRLAAALVEIPNSVEAAAKLGISAHTAKSQLGAAMRKTGVRSKVELLLLLRQAARGQ